MDAAKTVAALEGPTRAAVALTEKVGLPFTQSQVSNWLVRGIPWRWRDPIRELLAERTGQPKQEPQNIDASRAA